MECPQTKWNAVQLVFAKGVICALLILPLTAVSQEGMSSLQGNPGYTETPVEGVSNYLDEIRAPEAWKYLKDKRPYRRIDIGIIDSGFYGLSEGKDDFGGRLKKIPPQGEQETHGTIAAAIAAASGNNTQHGNVGINWTSEVSLGIGSYSSNLARIFWNMVQKGVDVINISLGNGQPALTGDGKCDAGESAMQFRFIREIAMMINAENSFLGPGAEKFLVVIAVGNDDCDLGRDLGDIRKPGNLLIVGGSREGTAAAGSNKGGLIDIAAPYDVQRQYSYKEKTYSDYNGTSYSAPQVAGAAALAWAFDPELKTSGQVVERLKKTAQYVIPEFGGAGVLDVHAALTGKKTAGDKASGKKKKKPVTRQETQRPERVY